MPKELPLALLDGFAWDAQGRSYETLSGVLDYSARVAAAGPEQTGLLRAGGLLLLVVFALKAALVPLGFWLSPAYSAACAPVAAQLRPSCGSHRSRISAPSCGAAQNAA